MKKLKYLWIQNKELILYVFFGMCTTVINFVAYFLCKAAGADTVLSTVIAWVLAVLFAFVTNKVIVFESKNIRLIHILKELFSFCMCRVITGILDLLIMVVFVDIMSFNELIMKAIANLLVIVLNYIASKLFIFKN